MIYMFVLTCYPGKKKGLGSQVSQLSGNSDDTVSISSMSLDTSDMALQPSNTVEEVLVISLNTDQECPGMMSEHKVGSLGDVKMMIVSG